MKRSLRPVTVAYLWVSAALFISGCSLGTACFNSRDCNPCWAGINGYAGLGPTLMERAQPSVPPHDAALGPVMSHPSGQRY